MKLEQELVRQILLAVEASDHIPIKWVTLSLEGWDPQLVSYHVQLLAEAGFVDAQNLTNMSRYEWQPKRLTFAGHEFLDTVRDAEVWRRTKEGAAKAGGAGVQLLWEIGKAYAKQVAKERLGLDLS